MAVYKILVDQLVEKLEGLGLEELDLEDVKQKINEIVAEARYDGKNEIKDKLRDVVEDIDRVRDMEDEVTYL